MVVTPFPPYYLPPAPLHVLILGLLCPISGAGYTGSVTAMLLSQGFVEVYTL
jgi:hypothetical protein